MLATPGGKTDHFPSPKVCFVSSFQPLEYPLQAESVYIYITIILHHEDTSRAYIPTRFSLKQDAYPVDAPGTALSQKGDAAKRGIPLEN